MCGCGGARRADAPPEAVFKVTWPGVIDPDTGKTMARQYLSAVEMKVAMKLRAGGVMSTVAPAPAPA